MAKERNIRCPHCQQEFTVDDDSMVGVDALMGFSDALIGASGPGVGLLGGTTGCPSCDERISIERILKGEYNVATAGSVVARIIGLLVLAAIGYFVFFS